MTGRDESLVNKTHYTSNSEFRTENSHALFHLNNPFLRLFIVNGTGMKRFIATFCSMNRVNLPNCVSYLCILSTSGNTWHITRAHLAPAQGLKPPPPQGCGYSASFNGCRDALGDQDPLAALERLKSVKVGKGTQISFLLLPKRLLSVPRHTPLQSHGTHLPGAVPGSVRCAGIIISPSETSQFG